MKAWGDALIWRWTGLIAYKTAMSSIAAKINTAAGMTDLEGARSDIEGLRTFVTLWMSPEFLSVRLFRSSSERGARAQSVNFPRQRG